MKMKRWISILLTLALCLGLLPGVALAEGEGTVGLKLCADEAGEKTITANSDGSYTIGYSVESALTLYLHITGDESALFAEGMTVSTPRPVSTALSDDRKVLAITHSAGDASGCTVDTMLTVGGQEIAFKLAFVNDAKIYDDKGNSAFTVNAGMEQAFTFPPTIYVDGVSTRLVAEDYTGETYTFTTTVGSLYWHAEYDELAINTTVATAGETGTITITNTVSGVVYTCEVTVREDSSGEEDNPSTETSIGLQLYAADGTTPITANEDGSYIVNITEGADTIVYVRITGDDAAVFDEGTEFVVSLSGGPPVPIVDSALSEDGKILKITHHGAVDAAEYMESGRTLSVGGQQIVLAIKFVNEGSDPGGSDDGNGEGDDSGESNGMITVNGVQYSQMYYQFKPGSYATDIEVNINSRTALVGNLFADSNGTTNIDVSDYTVSFSGENLGAVVDNGYCWDTNSNAVPGASGYLCAVSKIDSNIKYAIAVSIKAQSGGNQNANLTDERPLEDNDKRDINWDEFSASIDTITYKGVTYYVNSLRTFPGAVGALQPDGNGSGGGEITIGRCIGFYQSAAEGNITTPSDELISELVARFNETLSLKLYAVTNPSSKYEIYRGYPQKFPATQAFDGFGKWPCGIAHQFSEGASGRWLIEITGTFTDEQNNTKTVKTQVLYTNEVPPSETYNATSLADANAKLADWAKNGDSVTQYNLNLPEGELTGTLVIPEGERITFIRGHEKTTVFGGVYLDNAEVILQGINFVGAGKTVPGDGEHVWEHRDVMKGKGTAWRGHWAECYEVQWQKVWPERHTNNGKPNYAVYGTGNAQIQHCTFTGYYHALHSAKDDYGDGVICGDMESIFRNNAVVYYLDGYYRGQANSDMLKSKFINNGCAFWVEDLSSRVPTGQYRFIACTFAYNQLDVVNLSGRWFFMPNNFFAGRGPDNADIVGPVFAQNAVSRSPDAESESHVSAFPYAADNEFEELIYEKDAVMSSGDTQDYKIPEEELNGMTITIIENDQEAAVWSFGEEE